jgi:arginase
MQECDAIAGEELAILSGIGDPRLTRLASRAPMLDLADVVLVGVRDSDPSLRDVASRGARLLTSSELDVLSPERAARRAVDLLTTDHLDGFWVQFDVDVIDASEMPAVDTPEHGGPTLDYMAAFLRTALSSRKVIGMSVTLYDPDRDVDGRCGRRLADLLVNAVSASA